MNKYLKYLITLFLAFGLMVSDGIIHFQSNSVLYYQVSYVKTRNEFSHESAKLYRLHQINSSEKTTSPILFSHLKFQDFYSLQTRVLLKLRVALYQNISATKALHIFLSQIISSSNHYPNLYIA